MADGVGKGQPNRLEHLSLKPRDFIQMPDFFKARSIQRIANQRVSQVRHMDPNLMGSPRLKLEGHFAKLMMGGF